MEKHNGASGLRVHCFLNGASGLRDYGASGLRVHCFLNGASGLRDYGASGLRVHCFLNGASGLRDIGASGTHPDALRFTSLRFVKLPTECWEGGLADCFAIAFRACSAPLQCYIPVVFFIKWKSTIGSKFDSSAVSKNSIFIPSDFPHFLKKYYRRGISSIQKCAKTAIPYTTYTLYETHHR